MPRRALLALVLLAFAASGCQSFADPFSRKESLKQSQKKYTEMIRWGDLDRASHYVDPELLEDFLAYAPAFEDIRVTDFEIGEIDYAPDAVDITVTYRGYSIATLVERPFRERQAWYREGGFFSNQWRVRPSFADLVQAIGEPKP